MTTVGKQAAVTRTLFLILCHHTLQEPGFLDELIKESRLQYQCYRCVKFSHLTLIEHHDAVTVDDCVDAMRDRDDGPVTERSTAERLLQQRIRLNVHRSLHLPVSRSNSSSRAPDMLAMRTCM
jgi:hypothetical protein